MGAYCRLSGCQGRLGLVATDSVIRWWWLEGRCADRGRRHTKCCTCGTNNTRTSRWAVVTLLIKRTRFVDVRLFVFVFFINFRFFLCSMSTIICFNKFHCQVSLPGMWRHRGVTLALSLVVAPLLPSLGFTPFLMSFRKFIIKRTGFLTHLKSC